MNKEIKAIWVEALRSGKYEQIQGKLTDGKGYCCLGVLCEVTGAKGWQLDELLPKQVIQKAGLDYSDARVQYNEKHTSLVALNDDENLTFPEIADIIEEQL